MVELTAREDQSVRGTSIVCGSLWIVPDLWKRTERVSHKVVGRAERVHTLHKAYSWTLLLDEQNKGRTMTRPTI